MEINEAQLQVLQDVRLGDREALEALLGRGLRHLHRLGRVVLAGLDHAKRMRLHIPGHSGRRVGDDALLRHEGAQFPQGLGLGACERRVQEDLPRAGLVGVAAAVDLAGRGLEEQHLHGQQVRAVVLHEVHDAADRRHEAGGDLEELPAVLQEPEAPAGALRGDEGVAALARVLLVHLRDVAAPRGAPGLVVHAGRALCVEERLQRALPVRVLDPGHLGVPPIHLVDAAAAHGREGDLHVARRRGQVAPHVEAGARPPPPVAPLVGVAHLHRADARDVAGDELQQALGPAALVDLRHEGREARPPDEVLHVLGASRIHELFRHVLAQCLLHPRHARLLAVHLAHGAAADDGKHHLHVAHRQRQEDLHAVARLRGLPAPAPAVDIGHGHGPDAQHVARHLQHALGHRWGAGAHRGNDAPRGDGLGADGVPRQGASRSAGRARRHHRGDEGPRGRPRQRDVAPIVGALLAPAGRRIPVPEEGGRGLCRDGGGLVHQLI
mmetsp:Transcript_48266/g.146794  ORF Transcript_48266/g.146794 Transcript_48266/m.146794 type:complete len:496 (+) Transcript_48266:527-2014(+)